MASGKELRRHARRNVEGITLTCYRTENTGRYKPRKNLGLAILDISQGGCRVKLLERVDQGVSLTIELKDHLTGELFHAHGQVCWSQEQAESSGVVCTVGVRFLEIYTPIAKREKFFQGRALQATPARGPVQATPPTGGARSEADPASAARAPRFKVHDYTLSISKAGFLGSVGLRKGIASELVDLSRTGAQIAIGEKLAPGTRITFTLYLNKFADTFETEGEVMWIKETNEISGLSYFLGLKFDALTPSKQRLLDYMMSWFTSYQHKYRQEHKGSEGV